MKRQTFLKLWPFPVLITVMLYAPLLVVALSSLNSNRYGLQWQGFSMRWYAALWEDEAFKSALQTSISLAIVSAAISTVLGTMLGYALGQSRFRANRLLQRFLLIPLSLPDIVMGVSLALFYALVREKFGLFQLGFTTLVVAHITFQIPFLTVMVLSRVKQLDPNLREAASDLSASRWQVFRFVTMPLLMPSIAGGALLAFTLSLDDFVISFFTAGAGNSTLPILIYSSVKRGVTNQINALSTLLIVLPIVAMGLFALVEKRREIIEK